MNIFEILIIISLQWVFQAYRLNLNANYQYYSATDVIDFSNYLSGVWFKYQPLTSLLQVGMISQTESNSSLLFYHTYSESNNLFSISYLDIDYQQKRIQLQSKIKGLNQMVVAAFEIDPETIEGMWIYHYFYIQSSVEYFKIQIGYMNQNTKDSQSFSSVELLQSQTFDLVIGGGFDKHDAEFNQHFFLTYFLGILDVQIYNEVNGDIENVFYEDWTDNYYDSFSQELIDDAHLETQNFFQVESMYAIFQNFAINFWINYDEQTFGISYIFHISGILAENYKDKVGGNIASLTFENSEQHSQITFGYYSYDFPYFTEVHDIYKQHLTEKFQFISKKWYMITLQYFDSNMNLFIFNMELDIQFLLKLEKIKQFKTSMLYFFIGGDLTSISTISNRISLFTLTTEINDINIITCHFSCLKCDGPYSTNCLTCNDLSGREFFKGRCLCKVQYLEINQKDCYDFREYELIESPKIDFLCPYGYFYYQEECFLWYVLILFLSPLSSQDIYIYCTECISNWKNWVYNAVCTLNIQSNYDSSGTYNPILDSTEYFTFDEGELVLCQNCEICFDTRFILYCNLYKYKHLSQPTYIICLNGLIYSEETQDCIQDNQLNYLREISCEFNCGNCNSQGECIYCIDPQKYYLSIDKIHCFECQIKYCKYCFQISSQHYRDIQYSSLFQNGDLSLRVISDDIVTYCALCYDGYAFNFTNGQCQQITLPVQCLRAYITINNETICLISQSNNFFNNEISIADCSTLMLNCQQCIHNKNQRLFCLKCTSGYYVDANTGTCKSCFGKFNQTEVKECQFISYFYQDQWMIEIQPFYNSFFIGQQIQLSFASYRSYIVIKECQENYKLFNQECLKTYDTESCLYAGYAEYQYYCQTCKMTEGQASYSYDPNNLFECLACPYQCQYCQPRAKTDIQLINSDFIGNSDFTNICLKQFQAAQLNTITNFFDTEFMYITLCQKYEKCQLMLNFIAKVLQFDIQDPYNVIDIDENLIQYMNMRQISQIFGVFNFTGRIIRNVRLSQLFEIKQNVFSMKKVSVKLTGSESLYTFDSQIQTGIDELIFENTSIQIFMEEKLSNFNAIIMNSNTRVILQMINVSITISSEKPLFNRNFGEIFKLLNMHLVQLSNVTLENMYLQYDFLYFQSTFASSEIIIENMILKNLTFSNSSLFKLNDSNQISMIMIKNIVIINCTFSQTGAYLTTSQNYQHNGTIIIDNISIYNSTFVGNSFLLNINSVNSLILSNVELELTTFVNSNLVSIFECNNLSINNLIIKNTSLQVSNILYINGNTALQITNLNVLNNEIQQSSIITMQNSENSNVSIISMNQTSMSVNQQQNVSSSCFYNMIGNEIVLNMFQIEKSTIYKDFCLQEFDLIKVSNVQIVSTNTLNINPLAKCLDLSFYHNSFLYIMNFKVVNVFNLTASNLLFVNSSLLYFMRQQFFDEQQIDLKKISLNNNRIIKLTVNLISTLIYIYSDTKLSVILSQLQFTNNWINHYLIDFEIVSPGIIYVVANQIQLSESQFYSNLITNTSESMIFFNSITVNINNITSDNVNPSKGIKQFDTFFQNYEIFNKIFPIESQGGFFSITCQSLLFTNSEIINSIATIGGVFFIQVQLEGYIHFENNKFINTTAKSQTTLQGIGGCIYLDASSSSLSFSFINNTVIAGNSKYVGGVVFIQPSKIYNDIKLSQVTLTNIHSLKGALLHCLFSDESTNNTILIQQIKIEINLESFQNYVIEQQFTEYDDQFWSEQTGIIHIINSNIVIQEIMFYGLALQPLLYLQFSQFMKIKNLQIINVLQYSNSMINLNNYKIIQSQNNHFLMEKVILSNIQVISLSQQTCLTSIFEQFTYIFCSQNQNVLKVQRIKNYDCIMQQKMALINDDFKQLLVLNSIQGSIKNKISDIQFHNITCSFCISGIFTILTTNLKLSLVLMNNNICGQTGCLSIQNQNEVYLMDSIFFNNSAYQGGAIYATNVNLYINRSKIFKNQASYGGGIYFISSGNEMMLYQTKIFNNKASINGGGMMLINYSISADSTLQIYNNSAKDGVSNIFSQIAFLKLQIFQIISTNKKVGNWEFAEINASAYIFVPSGQTLTSYQKYDNTEKQFHPLTIYPRILAYNQLGEQLLGINEEQCSVYQNNNSSYTKLLSVNYDSQMNYFDLSSINITLNPYQNLTFTQVYVNCTNQIDQNYTLFFYFKTFYCQPGEYLTNNACLKCDPGKGLYSVKANQTECFKINTNSMKGITSSELNLNTGYWRQNSQIAIPVLCYKAQQNCLGGWSTGDSSCSKGNIGALCEECDIYNIRGDGKYQKQFSDSCALCGDIAGIIIKMICIAIWTLGSIWVTVQSTNNSNEQLKQLKMSTKFYEVVFKQNQDKAGSLIKMLANYCQIILALKTFQLQFMINFPNIISPISDPTGSFSYSFDCYLSETSIIQIIYGRIIWMICLALSYLLLYILLYLIYCKLLSIDVQITTITTSILYLFTYTQPSMINELVKLIAVKNISDIDYIQADLSYLYYTKEHFYWVIFMVLPIIILYTFLIPGIILYKLTVNKTKLNRRHIRDIWGYMYYEYQKKKYYWEIVKIIQRIMIIFILNYLDSDVSIKSILICFIVFTYQKLIVQMAPYCLTYLNNYEKHYIFFCAIIVLLGNLIYQIQTYGNVQIEFLLQILLLFLVIHILVNILFQIFKSYITKYNEKIDLIRSFIKVKYPKFQILCPSFAKQLKLQKKVRQEAKQRFQKIRIYLKLQVSQKRKRIDSELQSENLQTQSQQTNHRDRQIKLEIYHKYQESQGSVNSRMNDILQYNSLKRSQDQILDTNFQ